MKITRLDHVQLAMPAGGEDKAREFYDTLLGLVEIPKPVELAKRGGCWFQSGDVQIHLGVEENFKPAKKAHPAFCVSNLDALRTRLEQAGIEMKHDPATPEMRRFHISDCFGNRLEFMQEGEKFKLQ